MPFQEGQSGDPAGGRNPSRGPCRSRRVQSRPGVLYFSCCLQERREFFAAINHGLWRSSAGRGRALGTAAGAAR
jgi:hypothetical protein